MIDQQLFARRYDAKIIDLPSAGADWTFDGPRARSRGSTILVEPQGGSSWLGRFAAADPGRQAVTAVAGTPSPTWMCVVEQGAAFVGDVCDPESFAYLDTPGPVVDLLELSRLGVLLLLTPTALTAVGATGRWTSARIAIDGLRLDSTDHGWIRGVADPSDEEPREFAVELATGRVEGGAGLWK